MKCEVGEEIMAIYVERLKYEKTLRSHKSVSGQWCVDIQDSDMPDSLYSEKRITLEPNNSKAPGIISYFESPCGSVSLREYDVCTNNNEIILDFTITGLR